MELGDWDILFCPLTFDFHQLKISMFHQEEVVTLHGALNEATLVLDRKKDLKGFLQAKKEMLSHFNVDWRIN